MSTYVWAPHDSNAWEVGLVTASNDKSTTVKYPDNTTKILPLPLASLDTANPDTLKSDCDNLVDLDVFNEGVILHHVKKRFMKNTIYTFVGNILIAVNPYKKVDIYGVDVMETALKAAKLPGEASIPPHIYSIAAGALVGLRSESTNHSVLISGESGAGKTEATKKILQFLSSVSNSSASRAGVSVETQILDSNPLLESFGNAKTLRNNNSSRFGKYMQINFNKRHDIKGCNVTAYLLEKSRVVTQNAGERNYHVFYMLLAGASVEMRKEFSLKPASACYYLNQSKCEEIKNRNETKEFEELVAAMGHLNFNKDKQAKIFKCLAGILHLGNIVFVPFHGDGGVEGSHVKAKADLKTAASLLGMASAEELERALCFNERVIAGETTYSPIDVTRACDQRDALAKYIYGKLFDWIVFGVNDVLYRGKPGNSIGILDIFGFEVFQVNSFEQLCINYCNERLQTFFNEVIFEGEMRVYESEGVACDGISFQDNKGCVRLVDLKGASVFGFLDEEIMVPKGSEEKLMKKLHHYFDETPGTKSPYYGRNRKKPNTFVVKHFAGEVTYVIDNFMEKNKDTLAQSLLNQCSNSSMSLLAEPVPVIDMSGDAVVAAAMAPEPEEEKPGKGGRGGKSANKLTLCAKFKIELDDLITNLRSTVPHFVRCVKPNDVQTADKFDAVLTLNQLKYSGLFEAINIRKSGFASRIPHDVFINCYSTCVPPSAGGTRKDWAVRGGARAKSSASVDGKKAKKPPAICYNLLEFLAKEIGCPNVDGQQANWAVGMNRVFIKNQTFRNKLDSYKTAKVSNMAVVHIQRVGRGYNARRRTAHLMPSGRKNNKAEAKKKEAQERGLMHAEEELSRAVEEEFLADTELQRSIKAKREANRVARAEKERKAELHGATLIQKVFRGVCGRIRGRVFMLEKMLEQAIRSRSESGIENGVRMTTGFFYALHHLQYRPVHRNPQGALNSPIGSPMGSPMAASVGSPLGVSLGASMRSPPKTGGKAKYVPYTWGCSTRLLRAYHVNAKEVLTEVQGETYMSSQLQTAINTQSIDILKDALSTAHALKMDYLPEYAAATELVDDLLHERSVLTTIAEELSKCTTVPALLDHVDTIMDCVRQATRLGLSGEYAVHNAAMRVGKIKTLVELRDRMRFAVEIASASKMQAALAERAKHVRIFGEELLAEELVAVQGLLKMFSYEEQLKRLAVAEAGASAGGSAGPEDEGSRVDEGELAPAPPLPGSPSSTETPGKGKGRKTVLFDAKQDKVFQSDEDYLFRHEVPSAPDARLPPTLRHMLEEMRNAVTSEELQLAGERLAVLVPSAERRRAVLSAFKWVVSFATWRYTFKNEAEMALYEQHKRVIGETMNSPVKRQMGVDKKAAAPPESVYRRPKQLLEVLSSPGRSFGSPIKAVSRQEFLSKSLRDQKQEVLRASSKAIKKSEARMERLQLAASGPGPKRRLSTSSMMSMASFKSSASKSSIGSTTMGTSNIPFTQRRSRSEVAALEALKKTKELSGTLTTQGQTGHADELLRKQLAESEREYQKFQKKRAWA